MNFCPICGAEVNGGNFCERCGALLGAPTDNMTPPYTVVGEENPYALGTQPTPSDSFAPSADSPVVPKSMTEAVRICFKKFNCAQGRASRTEYWYFALFNFLIQIIIVFVGALLTILTGSFRAGENGFALVVFVAMQILYVLSMLVPSVYATIRRLHDSDHTGWWFLLALVPFHIGRLVLLIFMLLAGTNGPNKYGPQPVRQS